MERDSRLLYRLIRQIDFFSDLSMGELEFLVDILQPFRCPAGTILMKEGELGNALYLIAAGRVSVWAGKQKKLVAFIDEGRYFGEMALLDDQIRKATVAADTKCELYVLHRQKFWELLKKNPTIEQKISAVQEKRRVETAVKQHQKADQGTPEAISWGRYRMRKFFSRFFS